LWRRGGASSGITRALRAVVTVGGVDVGLRAVDRRAVSGAQGAGGGGTVDGGSSAGDGGGGSDDGARTVRAWQLIDTAGFFSPMAAQARRGSRPNGVCVVVGSCADGAWPSNKGGDLLVAGSDVDAGARMQLFWETVPAAKPAGEAPPARHRRRRGARGGRRTFLPTSTRPRRARC